MAQHTLPALQKQGRVGIGSRAGGAGNKLNRETAMLVLASLRRGSTRASAFAMAGVSKDTFLRWLDYRKVPDGVILPNLMDPESMIDFSGMPFHEAVTRAQQEASDFLASRILAASTDGYRETHHYGRNGAILRVVREWDWKAAAWLLEHNPEFRKEWAAPKQVELSGVGGGPVRTEGVQIITWTPDADWMNKYAAALSEIDEGESMINVTPALEAGDDDQTA